jgi:cytochrome P450
MKYSRYRPHQTEETPLIAPGPAGNLMFGNLYGIQEDRLHAFMQLRRDYGDVVRLNIGPRILHLVSHPDLVEYILQDNNKNYTKGRGLEKAKPLLGEGLLTSEGEFWRRQRRLAQPAFHRKKISGFVSTMTQAAAQMLARWDERPDKTEPLNIAGEMMRLTLDVVSRTLFSTGLQPGETESVADALPFILRETTRRLSSPFGLREHMPIQANRQFQEDLQALNKIVFRIINERRKAAEAGGQENLPEDLLGMLMFSRDDETGEVMSDHQLRDEVMTIFLAGHETTANNLAWTFYLLSKNPDVRARLQEEVDRVLGGRQPDLEDIQNLVYTRQILDESLRLFPPAWAIGRQAIEADQVGGYLIPPGSGIVISTYVVHRHPEFWENPEGFDPDRFESQRVHERPHYAYIPFGGGPRLCIGNNFALQESTLVLAMVTQRYALDLVPGHPVVPETAITLRPRYGIQMTLHPR